MAFVIMVSLFFKWQYYNGAYPWNTSSVKWHQLKVSICTVPRIILLLQMVIEIGQFEN